MSDPTSATVRLCADLIRARCVNDGSPESGHEHRAVEILRDHLGVAGEVVESAPGRQSLVVRIPGTDPGAPSLCLMGHTDVVPVTESGWSQDPFGGEVRDGYLWGRGAVDMLNVTSAMAVVTGRYLRGELPPLPGDLIFFAVADEEAGGILGARHVLEERPELVEAEYLLTEIAMPTIPTPGGPVIPVTASEKGPAWRRYSSRGVPGHASQPHGRISALVPAARAVARFADDGGTAEISDEWRRFVAGLGLSPDEERAMTDPDRIDEAIDRLAVEDPGFARWVHACTRLTVTPTTLHSGVKANVVPDVADGDLDVRVLPGQDAASVDEHFRKVLGPDLYDDLEFDIILDESATASAPEGLLWESIGDAAEAVAGHRRLLPALIPVGTDARFFRRRGTVAYGVGLFDERMSFGDLLTMFHGNDERVSLGSLDLTTALLAETVGRFGERSSPGP
ncbi:MAG: M20/M25/M40 family metallo-hydrolase [Acidimicrobiia bacterium]|nr:M20/M25/M40 family metallo-hydrolase [Acidimicrobiia bacterium]